MNILRTFLFGFLALAASGLALSDGGVVTRVDGNATVQTGSGAPRTLRLGDSVLEGDTVATGPNSAVIVRFEDGQVAALSSRSRMTVTTYKYNASAKSGNVLFSLLDGGLRAVTGLIGKVSPQAVSYTARTATIGIRGTDVTMVTSLGDVIVTVEDGVISFTFEGKTITVQAGQGVNARTNQPFQAQAISQIIQQLQGTPQGQSILDSINGLGGLSAAISQAASGTGTQLQTTDTSTTSTPSATAPAGAGGGGGGTPSVR
jgi:hypothetical protein